MRVRGQTQIVVRVVGERGLLATARVTARAFSLPLEQREALLFLRRELVAATSRRIELRAEEVMRLLVHRDSDGDVPVLDVHFCAVGRAQRHGDSFHPAESVGVVREFDR